MVGFQNPEGGGGGRDGFVVPFYLEMAGSGFEEGRAGEEAGVEGGCSVGGHYFAEVGW